MGKIEEVLDRLNQSIDRLETSLDTLDKPNTIVAELKSAKQDYKDLANVTDDVNAGLDRAIGRLKNILDA